MNDVDSKTGQAIAVNPRSCTSETLLLALFLLFFVQLATVWIESIYRLSLIKLSMGREMLGILLPLLALLLWPLGRRAERGTYLVACGVLLAARALCPFLGAPWLIVNAGVGVAAFLVVLCHWLSRRAGRADFAVATGLAVLASASIRAWGSSLDVTMEIPGAWAGWCLVVFATMLLGVTRYPVNESESCPAGRLSFFGNALLAMAVSANFAIVYLVLSSPSVVGSWSGGNGPLATAVFALCMGAAVTLRAGNIGRHHTHLALLAWNLAFVLLLIAGIRLNAVPFPGTATSGPMLVAGAAWYQQAPLYLMLALSPVIPLNILALTERLRGVRPCSLQVPVILGMGIFLIVTVMFIGTNVWGYMGAPGLALRNRFYLPFLFAGTLMILPFLWPGWRETFPLPRTPCSRPLSVVGLALCLFAIAAAAGNNMRTALPASLGQDKHSLTILTYNIQQGSAQNGNQSYRAQLEFMRSLNADIIGLQENDTARPSGGNVYAARYFADGLGYYLYDGPNTISGTFGTAILSRYPLSNCRTFFTYSMVDEVGTAVAEFEVGGRAIAFFNSHPAGNSDVHAAHVDTLLDESSRFDHVIAVGDYNFRQDSPHYARVAAVFTDSWRSLYPDAVGRPYRRDGKAPSEGDLLDMTDRIDHIFMSPSFRVVESCYVPPPESQTDHPAHWTILEWD